MEVSWSPGTPTRGRGRDRDRAPAGEAASSRSTSGRSGPETLPTAGWKTENSPDSLPSLLCFMLKRRPGVQPPLSDYVDSPSQSDLSKYLDQASIKILFLIQLSKNDLFIIIIFKCTKYGITMVLYMKYVCFTSIWHT